MDVGIAEFAECTQPRLVISSTCVCVVPLSGDADGDEGTFIWSDGIGDEFVSSGPNQFLVRAQGGVAINSNDPAGNSLRVNGTLRVDTLGAAAANSLCRNASNQISGCSSSARYKRDIVDLSLGLDTALRLRAVGYRWKDTGAADVGFIAEEMANIDERLVTRNDKGEIEGVKYDRLTAVLANAAQELAARDSLADERIAELAKANVELRGQLAQLLGESTQLCARLERLETCWPNARTESPELCVAGLGFGFSRSLAHCSISIAAFRDLAAARSSARPQLTLRLLLGQRSGRPRYLQAHSQSTNFFLAPS